MNGTHIPVGLFGISHRTAPVDIRDHVALNEEEQKSAIQLKIVGRLTQLYCMFGHRIISG